MNTVLPSTATLAHSSGTGSELFVASLCVLAMLLTVAVYHEVRENRIPNWLTYSGMALGVGIAALGGKVALISSLAGLVVGFGFLFVFFLFGGVGGGDVKLMGAAGALMGFSLIQPAVVFTTILGAMLAILMLVWHRNFWAYLGSRLGRWVPGRRRLEGTAVEQPQVLVPYGLAIAAGCLLALVVRGLA
jgi:prepilin peptidase CpaA